MNQTHKRFAGCIVISAILLGLVPNCGAGLRWNSKEELIDARMDDAAVTKEFSFTNDGPAAVTIIRIATSCGCTTAELDQQIFAPHESGVVKVKISLEAATGTLQKTVLVWTDDACCPRTKLSVRVTIPALFTFDPPVVLWCPGKTDAIERVTITPVSSEHPATVMGVHSIKGVLADLQRRKNGQVVLTIFRSGDEVLMNSSIIIDSDVVVQGVRKTALLRQTASLPSTRPTKTDAKE